ncbi:hypothetical protein [Mucilaginibacter pedocola]|nr:hypothetical protein [Mucilaginibacter pedocola]
MREENGMPKGKVCLRDTHAFFDEHSVLHGEFFADVLAEPFGSFI